LEVVAGVLGPETAGVKIADVGMSAVIPEPQSLAEKSNQSFEGVFQLQKTAF
jgi:hypothetical protein